MIVIAIAGPSGSGKSELARGIRDLAAGRGLSAGILGEDGYYRDLGHLSDSERRAVNYDAPEALEHGLLLEHLDRLRAGRAVEVPVYDFVRRRRAGTRPQAPCEALVAEGILLLSDSRLRERFDFSMYIDVPLETCLARRLARDAAERGRGRESAIRQFEATVRPMFHRHIAPSRRHADLAVDGSGAPGETLRRAAGPVGGLLDRLVRREAGA